jgi:hypothetical protein
MTYTATQILPKSMPLQDLIIESISMISSQHSIMLLLLEVRAAHLSSSSRGSYL